MNPSKEKVVFHMTELDKAEWLEMAEAGRAVRPTNQGGATDGQ